MSFLMRAVGAAVAVTMVSSPVLAAEVVRPSDSIVSARVGDTAAVRSGVRVGRKAGRKSDIFGAPVFLVVLGGLAIIIGTIVITNNGDGSSSPG